MFATDVCKRLLIFMWVILVLTISLIVSGANLDNSNIVVTTPSGELRGSTLLTWTNKSINSFRGVPFAEPPLGNLRFKAPVGVKPWNNVKDATKDAKVCVQDSGYFGAADEDCLYLNVYTKNTRGNYPVIVFFHPGAFHTNTGASFMFGPHYLLDHDIVLVTVNYRLDALGFLSTGEKISIGNYGMKDQVEALRWVQKHIKSFGGNQNIVTIAGYSAGSSSTLLHMVSPMSKGLFHKIIAMSGGLTSDWVVTKDPLPNAIRLAKLLNCSTNSSHIMVECLKNIHAKEINARYEEQRIFASLPMVRFGPVIEADLGTGEERFLTDDPITLIKKKQFHHVPVVIGVTEYEFLGWFQGVLLNDNLREELVNNFDSLAPQIFGYSDKNVSEAQKITNTFKEFYFENKPITKNSVYEFGRFFSDFLIIYGVHTTTNLLVQYNEKPVYSYLFTYKGRFGHVHDPITNTTIGPTHHDELLYLFYISKLFEEFKENDPEEFMVKIEISFWKNFATNGNPTPDGSPVQWTSLAQNSMKYLNIGSELKMENFSQSPFAKRMKLWESLFPVF